MTFSASITNLVEHSQSDLVGIAPWWERVELGRVAEILNGFPWKSKYFNDHTGVPIIRIRDVTSGMTVTRYGGPIEDGYWIENGDLIVGMDGDFNSRIWKAERALLNQRVCRITPNEELYSKAFLALALPGYLQLVHDQTHSITVTHLSSKTVAEIPLPLPSLSEQRRITAKVDSLSEKSKPARVHLDHIPRLVEKYKQAILTVAFQGDLTGEWRQKHRSDADGNQLLDEIRSDHRAKWETSSKTTFVTAAPTTKTEQPFELPLSWSWAAAEEIVRPGYEIVYGIVQPGPKLTAGVPYVRGTDIENGHIKIEQLLFTSEEIAEKYARASLQGGDVLLGIIRATKVAIVPEVLAGANITQGTARFRPSRVIQTTFLARWLESPQAQAWLHSKYRGIDMPGLNLRDVRRLPVPLASLREQSEIAARIESAFAWISRLAHEATSARELIDHLDQAVLAKAFSGSLVPQDPNDEPASVLLERIKSQRPASPKNRRGYELRNLADLAMG